MAYVPVPKDLNAVKTKVMFNLTKRQILCFGGGALIGVPLFFLLKGHIGSSAAALCMMLVMLPFFLLIGVGLFYMNSELISVPAVAGAPVGIAALLAGVSATTWSYDGAIGACYMAGEVKDPNKTMPKVMIYCIAIVILLYAGLSTIAAGLIPLGELAASDAPIALAFSKIPVIGSTAGVVTAVMAIIVITGSVSGATMYQPRLEYAMAKDGLWYSRFAVVHPKYNTPSFALMAQAIYAIILVCVSGINDLLGYFTFICLVKNMLVFCTMFVHRKKADYKPGWSCPAWKVMTVIAIFANGILLVSTFLWAPTAALTASGVALVTGLPAYYFFDKRSKAKAK